MTWPIVETGCWIAIGVHVRRISVAIVLPFVVLRFRRAAWWD